jgi:hypothetical protein
VAAANTAGEKEGTTAEEARRHWRCKVGGAADNSQADNRALHAAKVNTEAAEVEDTPSGTDVTRNKAQE